MVGGQSYTVEILRKDSESDPDTAAAVALELINEDQIDLMLVGNTPETTNPVADQCEANGVPCISSVAPWQPWFFGRGGDPGRAVRVDLPLLLGPRGRDRGLHRHVGPGRDEQEGRRPVPQRRRRQRVGRPGLGFPAAGRGRLHDRRSRAATRTATRTSPRRSRAFKEANARDRHRRPDPARLHDVLAPGQAAGLRPKVATIGKALLFPSRSRRSATSARPDDRGLVEPEPPVSSSLTGADRARSWPTPTTADRQAVDAAARLRARAVRGRRSPRSRAPGSTDKEAVRDALKATTSTRSSARSTGAGGRCPERREDAARRRPVGRGRGASTGSTWSSSTTPGTRTSRPARLDRADHGRVPQMMPLSTSTA